MLVVGDEDLADAVGEDGALHPHAFESERTDDAQNALQLARAYAPDLILVDIDRPHAAALIDALLVNPLTEPVPIVVVGTFATAEHAARIIALGVARTLSKPVAAEALARAFDEILDAARQGRVARVTLGEPTLERLVERLSEELKRGLLDSVDPAARSCRIPLGEGTEVLGVLWDAIARTQAIVSQKTAGAVRFAGDAPEGTVIALAPWLRREAPGAERLGGRGRGAEAEVRLQRAPRGGGRRRSRRHMVHGRPPSHRGVRGPRGARRQQGPRARVPHPAPARGQRHPDAGHGRLRALACPAARRRAARRAGHPHLLERGPPAARARAGGERRRRT